MFRCGPHLAALVALGVTLPLALGGDNGPKGTLPPTGGDQPAAKGKEALAEYQIAPLDVLDLKVADTLPNQPVHGHYKVHPDGRVRLGYGYGTVQVAGLTMEQAQDAVRKQLAKTIREPQLFLEVAEYRGQILKAFDEVQQLREDVERRRAQLHEAEARLRLAEGRLEGARLRYGPPAGQPVADPTRSGGPGGKLSPYVDPARP